MSNVFIPKSWRPSSDLALRRIYDEVYRKAKALGYDLRGLYLTVYQFPRSVGQKNDHSVYYGQTRINPMKGTVIGFNSALIESHDEKKIRACVIHEIAHAVKTAQNDGHGPTWKRVGDDIGRAWNISVTQFVAPDFKIDRSQLAPTKQRTKYIIGCPICGMSYNYSRMCASVEHPALWRCSKCKVPLVRIK